MSQLRYRVKLRHRTHGDYVGNAPGTFDGAVEQVKRTAAAIYATPASEWSVVTASEIDEESARG